MNERKLELELENPSRAGKIAWLTGVLIIVNPQFSLAHDPYATVISTWSIVIATVIAIAASYLSFRFFFPMTVGSRPILRFIMGALAIIIPLVLVWVMVFTSVFLIISGWIIR